MPSAREFLLQSGAVPPPQASDIAQEDDALAGLATPEGRARSAARSATRNLNAKLRSEQSRQQFVERNQAADVPLDVESGVPAQARVGASFRRSTEDKMAFLSGLPGVQDVRLADTGDIIVRVAEKGGQPRDVLFDEMRLSIKDIADMAGDTPQIAATIAAAIATHGASFLPQLAATAGASFGVGATQDAYFRAADAQPIRPGEIALERGGQELVGAALPVAGKLGKGALNRLLAPFSRSAGPVERGAAEAVKDIQARTGIDIPLSAGQRTGSPSLIRAETFGENILGGGSLGERRAVQDQRVRELQQFLLETPAPGADMAEREIGERAAQNLGAKAQTVADEAAAAKQAAAARTTAQIGRELTGLSPNPAATRAGAEIRARAVAARDAFKAQNRANYGAVYAADGGKDEFIPTATLSEAANEIRERLKLAINEAEETGSGIFDASGREIMDPGKSTDAVLTELVPPQIRPFLGIGGKLKDKITLDQAIAARSYLNDLIDEGAALPGIPDAYLKKLAGALTQAIQTGVSEAPNPEIKALLERANSFYKANFAKFEESGVRELFRPSTITGHIPDAEVLGRITRNGGDVTALRRMRGLLGQNSAEYQAIRGSVADDILRNSQTTADILDDNAALDASAFINQIRGLNREFADELLGPGARDSLIDKAKLLNLARGDRIDPETAATILRGNVSNPANLIRLAVDRERMLDRVYHSRIMQRMVGGKLNAGEINPSEFVTRMVGESSPAELGQVLDLLKDDPALVADIRRKAIQNVFSRAQAALTPEDIALRQAGQTSGKVSAVKLSNVLTADESKNLATLIGPDRFKLLQDYLAVSASQMKKSELGKEAGVLVQAGIVSKLLQAEPSAAVKIARLKFASWMLSSDFLNFWAGSKANLGPWPKVRTFLLASQPAARELAEEFADEPEALAQVLSFIRDEDPGVMPGEPNTDGRGSGAEFLRQSP